MRAARANRVRLAGQARCSATETRCTVRAHDPLRPASRTFLETGEGSRLLTRLRSSRSRISWLPAFPRDALSESSVAASSLISSASQTASPSRHRRRSRLERTHPGLPRVVAFPTNRDAPANYDSIAEAFDTSPTVTASRVCVHVSVTVEFDQALVADPEVVGDFMQENPSHLPAQALRVLPVETHEGAAID